MTAGRVLVVWGINTGPMESVRLRWNLLDNGNACAIATPTTLTLWWGSDDGGVDREDTTIRANAASSSCL